MPPEFQDIADKIQEYLLTLTSNTRLAYYDIKYTPICGLMNYTVYFGTEHGLPGISGNFSITGYLTVQLNIIRSHMPGSTSDTARHAFLAGLRNRGIKAA